MKINSLYGIIRYVNQQKNMATIVHFDISADDVQRARKFYEKLFGWKIYKYPHSPEEYYYVETTNLIGEKGLSGGIAKRIKPAHGITNYIEVESIDDSIAHVRKLGGKIIEDKAKIPTVGYIAGCEDTEGNIFGLLQVEENVLEDEETF
jgi:predicted enzyme related to lactoylglutathione lyase